MSNEIKSQSIMQIEAASTNELKQQLTQGLSISARQLSYLAQIWRELENRGEDLSDLKSGLATYLPLIAEGKLAPEIVVKFAGQKTLISYAISLPLTEQRHLAENPVIPVVTIDHDQNKTVKEQPINTFSPAALRQVIGHGRIRTEDEQYRALLIAKPTKSKKSAKRRIARKITFETIDDIDVASIAGKRIKVCDLISALSVHYNADLESVIEGGRHEQ